MTEKNVYKVGIDAKVDDLIESIIDINNRFCERMTFIEKQRENALSHAHRDSRDVWFSIIRRLKSLGKLPEDFDQDDETKALQITQKGIIVLHKEQEVVRDHALSFLKTIMWSTDV